MPVSYEDEETYEETEDEEPKGLRRQLERVLQENKALSERLSRFEAAEFIRSHGFSDVDPHVLVGIPRDQWESKAKEVQEQADRLKTDAVRRFLAEHGINLEDIEGNRDEVTRALQRIAQASGIAGSPPPSIDVEKVTDPLDMIRIGLARKNR